MITTNWDLIYTTKEWNCSAKTRLFPKYLNIHANNLRGSSNPRHPPIQSCRGDLIRQGMRFQSWSHWKNTFKNSGQLLVHICQSLLLLLSPSELGLVRGISGEIWRGGYFPFPDRINSPCSASRRGGGGCCWTNTRSWMRSYNWPNRLANQQQRWVGQSLFYNIVWRLGQLL